MWKILGFSVALMALVPASVAGDTLPAALPAAGTAPSTPSVIQIGPPAPKYANEDPADDGIVGPPEPRGDCEALLKAEGARYSSARLGISKHKAIVCGAEQVVVYRRGPAGIAYDPPALVTCSMALALSRFDSMAQEEAVRAFGKRIARITHLGTYSCREMKAYPGWVSEHSYANAIDLATFALENGKSVSVLQHFDKADLPAKAEGRFLRAISRRAYDESVFSNVLTPFFDALHRNHFHVDLARYRNDGTRPSG